VETNSIAVETVPESAALTVFLCGDVMTGRGIDQVLPHPGNPALYESCVLDAREYVELAERASGPIKRPVSFKYIWGESLAELAQAATDARIINLETSITQSNDCWPAKAVHYRMHPQNIGCLTAARIDVCCLANNHVLDWGYAGLEETLQTLKDAGIAYSGAGRNEEDASAPAVVEVPGKGRVLVFSLGSITSGIPRQWGATRRRSGIALLEDLSDEAARRVAGRMRQHMQSGDIEIASIHWGSNWGHEIPAEQITFAHRLIEEGIAVVHGHSSHHARALEAYRKHLILYGCGDFLTDYEGISGHEEFRGDLALMSLLRLDLRDGHLATARLVPMQMRRFQLHRASSADTNWLCVLLNEVSAPFGTRLEVANGNSIVFHPL